MYIKKIILAAAFGLVSLNASAQFQNTAFGTVSTMNLTGNGDLTLSISASQINPANCVFSAYRLNSDSPAFRNYYALLLTARALETEVRFRISDSSCISGTNPQIIFLETRNP